MGSWRRDSTDAAVIRQLVDDAAMVDGVSALSGHVLDAVTRGSADLVTPACAPYPINQPGGAYGDSMGGAIIAGGISAALLHRERTGEALVVDASLLHMCAWATSFSIAMSGAFGVERKLPDSFLGLLLAPLRRGPR